LPSLPEVNGISLRGQEYPMGEVINLRQKRKERERDAKARVAEQNRLLSGRTKVEKTVVKAEKTRKERSLEGHKLTPDGSKPSIR
jgi:hypothetical protein